VILQPHSQAPSIVVFTPLPTWTISVDENGHYLRLAWELTVFLVDVKGYVFEALTAPRGTLLVTTGNWDIIPLLSIAPITIFHLPLRMGFERKENAEAYDVCLPCVYTCSGHMVTYEVRKPITSAEHVRIYTEVTRFELERHNTSVKVHVASRLEKVRSCYLPNRYV
jgi:hypothetical protein